MPADHAAGRYQTLAPSPRSVHPGAPSDAGLLGAAACTFERLTPMPLPRCFAGAEADCGGGLPVSVICLAAVRCRLLACGCAVDLPWLWVESCTDDGAVIVVAAAACVAVGKDSPPPMFFRRCPT